MRNRPVIFDFKVRKKAKVWEMERGESSSDCERGQIAQKISKRITHTINGYVLITFGAPLILASHVFRGLQTILTNVLHFLCLFWGQFSLLFITK